MSKFICDVCDKHFSHSGSLFNHKKRKHAHSKFQCDFCSFCSDTKFSLGRHKKRKHLDIPPTNRTRVKCTLCSESYFTKTDVLEHYINHHNISIRNETIEFINENDFYAWKGKVEKEDACEYVRKHSKYVSKIDGTTKLTFYCHRNGTFKSKSENKRRIKILGSNKIDGHCPAKIACSFFASGKITAVFCKNHVGHQPEIGRMRLSCSEKEAIANQIALKIPFEQILDDIKLSINTSEIDRIHLITRKDLLNIEQQYKLKEAIQVKEECMTKECISVESWVDEVKCELNDTINKDKEETTKKCKSDLLLQFLSIVDKAKTEEDFNIISDHIKPILPTIEAHQINTHLRYPTSHSSNSKITQFELERKLFSTKKPTNCEKDAIAAILLLEENNCYSEH